MMRIFQPLEKNGAVFPILGKTACAALAAAVLLAVSCQRQPEAPAAPPRALPDPASFDGERAFREVEALVALGLRDAGTPGAAKAAEHLAARLRDLGLETSVDEFEDACPRGRVLFRNVIGRLPGEGRGLVVLGSHYDTKCGMPGGFEGANDSGSSTGALLEMVRVLAAGPVLPFEVLFVFFDGEECMVRYGAADGLHGSRRLASQLVAEGRAAGVKGMILLDMIGDRDLTVTLPRNATPHLVSAVLDAAREEGARSQFGLYHHGIGDDHDPFLDAGIPAVDIIDFFYGSAPRRNDYWHTVEDRMDKIGAESIETVGRVTLRVLNRLAAE